MPDLSELITDLTAECSELDALVADLTTEGWSTETSAPGWTISHQISHLAWTDAWALRALREPVGFEAAARDLFTGPDNAVDAGAEAGARRPHGELLADWRAGRAELAKELAAADPAGKLPWFGPPMKPLSMATARIMETWAHGEDVADALGVQRAPTARLRHIAHLGFRTIPFAFAANGLPQPDAALRVELTAPDGELWVWGPADAVDRISGPALDFCLRVTQRRHPDDLALTAVGPVATAWLPIAQVFAGPPGAGRAPSA
ncbi:uncharacterized protein (TIGR03084 family) [Kitasatospora sp. MAP12-15]|uniref:TIGR03084 family metal-binding protein n=1 Tax=unclassified Kitasatospora TaxID=2633591 RepID=UPI0024758758|nr:TIGR03084 family metal-binding protein [Kitasatospora sp. MAP12-44]MDH6114193.1 uncharacterized protein (TIGR03084 family) [Kitasatospora sp. MAP12-44]